MGADSAQRPPAHHTGFLPARRRTAPPSVLPAARGCWFPRWPRRNGGSDKQRAQVTLSGTALDQPRSVPANRSFGP